MLYQRAIAVLERSAGPDHIFMAEPLSGYAKLLRKLKRKREASDLERRTQAIAQRYAFAAGEHTVDVRELGKR